MGVELVLRDMETRTVILQLALTCYGLPARLALEDRQMPTPTLRLAGESDAPVGFDKAVDRYIEDMQIHGNAATHRAKERSSLRRARDVMGWRLLNDLSTEDIRNYMIRLGTAQRAAKTIKLYRDSLDRFGKWAVKAGLMSRNPVDGVPAPMLRPHQARVIPTEDELRRIIEAGRADWRAKDWWLAVLTMATTGLRVSEARGLEWSMVDLSSGTIHLPASITKSKRDQRAFLTPELVALLSEHHKACKGPRVFVSAMKRGQMLVYCRKAGVLRVRGTKTLSYHSFRHFCSNRLMVAGFTTEERQQAMRHSNISMTAEVYTDPAQVAASSRFASLPPILVSSAEEKLGRFEVGGLDSGNGGRYVPHARSEKVPMTDTIQHDAPTTGLPGDSLIWRSKRSHWGPVVEERCVEQGVAQLGRAGALGAPGHVFKSRHPDSFGPTRTPSEPTPAGSGPEVQIPRPCSEVKPDPNPLPYRPGQSTSSDLARLGTVLEAQGRALEANGLAIAAWMKAIGLVLAIAVVVLAFRAIRHGPDTVTTTEPEPTQKPVVDTRDWSGQ